MMVAKLVGSVLIVLAICCSLSAPLLAESPVAGVFLFQSEGCSACQAVEDEVLTSLKEEYGERLGVRAFSASSPKDYRVLLELEQKRGVHLRQVPAIFIGQAFLDGEDAIREELPNVIQSCLTEAGCPFPSDAQPSHSTELASLSPPPQLLERMGSPMPGAVGYSGTEAECPSCLFGAAPVSAAHFYRGTNWTEEEWSWFAMRYWLEHRQNLGLRSFDVDYADNEALWENLCQYYDRSGECTTPAVFVGAYALLDEEIAMDPLIAAWNEYGRKPVPSPLQLLEEGLPRPEPAPASAIPHLAGVSSEQPSSQRGSGPVAHAAFFYSPTCPHCKVVEEEVLPILESQYGLQFEVQSFNVKDAQGYQVLLDLEAQRGVHIEEVPVVFIGGVVLEGEEAIRRDLGAQIETCLQDGGCSPPAVGQPGDAASVAESAQPLPLEEELGPGVVAYRGTGEQGGEQPPVAMAYFFEQGCQVCDRAWYDLRYLLSKYADPYVRVYDIAYPESKLLHEALSQHYDVPEEKHLSTPALFIGDRYFLGHDITLQNLETVHQEFSTHPSPAPWELAAGQTEQARTRILDRFQSFGLYTVVAAGLIDGLNPCAFATIVLFISYLAISGRKGREILTVGAAFTLGVFLAYLLIGLGLWRLLETLDFLPTVGRWVYLITGLICLILAVFSLLDYRKARRGDLEDMSLSLPHGLRMRINSVIRQSRRARAYVGAAFITGLAVSIIELACTGQVYLPTIIFVMGVPELRVRAFAYLLLYNLVFILPLVVVFILAFRGTTSKQLTRFLQTRAATVKLAMSVLFLALSGWLLYAVFWG